MDAITLHSANLRFLAGGGEMGSRIRAHDWSAHPLGLPAQWHPTLRTTLALCLNSSIPTCVYWGPELRLLYNDAWAPIPGDRHPAALGSTAAEVWQDIWAIIQPQFEHVLTAGVGFATYDQMLPMRRHGLIEETFWNYSFSPIRDELGNVVGIFNQGHETTEKVRTARASRNELDRLRELFDQAPGATAVLEGPQHVYTIANAAYMQLIGPRPILGRSVAEVLPEVIDQGFGEVLDRVYNTGERFLAAATPVRLRRKPGEPLENRILDFVFQPIRRPGDGITGIFVQATDVTERSLAEAALRSSEENLRRLNERLEALVQERTRELSATLYELQSVVHRMRTTLQTSFIYQGYLRPDGMLLEANSASLAGIECEREAVVGRYFWDTPWFTDTPGMPEMVREAIGSVAKGESMRQRIDVLLPIGWRTFDFSMRPVKDERGTVIGIVPEAVDMTPVLQTEERLRQSQKMEAVGQLTGGIAHDFNNLLTGIVGSLDMIERRIAQGRYDRVSDYAKAAIASANRAAALTHRLLAFARRQPLDPKPVAANALIASVDDMLRRTLGEKIRLEVLAGGDLWLTRCDPNQLENALLNLVINARDAMPQGGQITIETSNREIPADSSRPLKAGQYVCISVRDTGVGMAPEVIAKAFDPFFTTKPLGQGTGLGLSMIYGFVMQSDGDITIKSQVGIGSNVTLYLPRFVGELPANETQINETGAFRTVTQHTVLVVEDDAVVRRLISDVLSESGYRVIEAPDGRAGLQLLMSDEQFELLISDVGLPQLDGRDMIALARAHRPKLKVLFITGYAEHAGMGSDWLAEDMELLAKPFTMETLAQQVTQMIGNP